MLVNGAYGDRIAKMAAMQSIAVTTLKYAESQPPAAADVRAALAADPAITHVIVVHCETTSGMLNPIEPIGRAAKEFGKTFVVDAMSSFGAIPIDLPGIGIDFLVSSSNKCIEGVPGFSFVLCRRDGLGGDRRLGPFLVLESARPMALHGEDGAVPLHAAHARGAGLRAGPGGIGGRRRPCRPRQALPRQPPAAGLRHAAAGFPRVSAARSCKAPSSPRSSRRHIRNFDFRKFYDRLHDRGHVIYFGKVTTADCFRIGNIGRLFESDIDDLLGAIARTLEEMQVALV